MPDISNEFRLSQRASEVAERFVNEGWFKHASEAALFAASYVLRSQFDSFDPATYIVSDNNGSNYNISTFDNDGTWSNLLTCLYKTDSPRLYLRNIIVYGLELCGTIIDEAGVLRIGDFV